MTSYSEIRNLLEKNLGDSAFRRGTSTHRLGLLQEGISDHLPIKISSQLEEDEITLISWNLLADAHLYNNFMNITGTHQLLATLSSENIYRGNKESNKLYYYFSELGEFLYKNAGNKGIVTLDKALLDRFNSLKDYSSLLARSRDPNEAKKKIAQAEESRKEIAAILLNPEHKNAHEFKLAIQHSLDLTYHILDAEGALKWKNRSKKLVKNKDLCSALNNADFVCLQECTNPDDIKKIIPQKECLTHRVNNTTNDHCVLFYDSNKFELIKKPDCFGLDEGKKPCIIARFKNRASGASLIVGSIHYPGGDKYFNEELMKKINSLKLNDKENIPFYLPGDYNHSSEFFNAKPSSEYQLFYPGQGTMAGADYGNNNKSIDALFSNVNGDAGKTKVERVDYIPISQPAKMAIKIEFKDEEGYRPSASSFNIPVQREVSKEEAKNAVEYLGQNDATYAPQMSI